MPLVSPLPPARALLPWVVLCVLPLPACRHGSGRADRAPLALPGRYAGADAIAARPAPDRWWESFSDPTLTRLVDRSLSGNFQVQAAWARLRQADAISRQVNATLFPVVNADANVRGQRQVFRLPSFGMPGGGAQDVSIEQILYSASIGAAYEVDIWGKLGAQRAAAALDARAAREQVEALAVTLTAQVADVYFNRVTQRAQADLLGRQLAVNEAFAGAVLNRFQRGIASAADVLQQQQQVSATKAQLALVAAQAATLDRQLALLVGQASAADLAGARVDLPVLPPLPAAGVPADLLARRPDVRAARLAVEASDARVSAAVRSWLPALNLSGSIGLAASSPSAMLESVVWSFLVGLTQTVFDGGRKSAEVARTRAALDQTFAQYGDTLLTALTEVENALVNERQQKEYLLHLETQLDQATRALDQARVNYAEGQADFLYLLTNLVAHQRVEQAVLAARRQLLSFRVALHRALAGGWTAALTDPRQEPKRGT